MTTWKYDDIPTGFGPAETARLLSNHLIVPLGWTYTYDNLYRLTKS